MIYAGYVKVAPGKPQIGRVKLKLSSGTGEAVFSLGEGKIPLSRVSLGLLHGDVANNYRKKESPHIRFWQRRRAAPANPSFSTFNMKTVSILSFFFSKRLV